MYTHTQTHTHRSRLKVTYFVRPNLGLSIHVNSDSSWSSHLNLFSSSPPFPPLLSPHPVLCSNIPSFPSLFMAYPAHGILKMRKPKKVVCGPGQRTATQSVSGYLPALLWHFTTTEMSPETGPRGHTDTQPHTDTHLNNYTHIQYTHICTNTHTHLHP